jgi:hypothetical protein
MKFSNEKCVCGGERSEIYPRDCAKCGALFVSSKYTDLPNEIWSMEDKLTRKKSYALGVICVLLGLFVVWFISFI